MTQLIRGNLTEGKESVVVCFLFFSDNISMFSSSSELLFSMARTHCGDSAFVRPTAAWQILPNLLQFWTEEKFWRRLNIYLYNYCVTIQFTYIWLYNYNSNKHTWMLVKLNQMFEIIPSHLSKQFSNPNQLI